MSWVDYFQNATRLVNKKINAKSQIVNFAPDYFEKLTKLVQEYNKTAEGKMLVYISTFSPQKKKKKKQHVSILTTKSNIFSFKKYIAIVLFRHDSCSLSQIYAIIIIARNDEMYLFSL